jgi:imidazolonepropionase-like amidohydrolase
MNLHRPRSAAALALCLGLALATRRCGTIAAGSCADLTLLDANPLQDLANVDRKRGVMIRGRWIPENEIQRQLARIRETPGNYRSAK